MAFTFIGGSVALDLLATVRDWEDERTELLAEPEVFARWCVGAHLTTEPPTVSEAEMRGVRRLRGAGYRLIRDSNAGLALDPDDRLMLNEYASHPPIGLRLEEARGLMAEGAVRQVLSSIARELMVVLSGQRGSGLRQCDGAHCTRFFIDTSRAGNRRFCSDRICGNRAKVAAHRLRAKAVAVPEPAQRN